MIQQWTKDSSNGRTSWIKKTIASNDAKSIIVTNPEVISNPSSLDSVLGKFKNSINELYGNVKWLSLHGGGGAGGGSNGNGGSVETTQIKIYGEYNGNSETDFIASGITNVSVTNDSYQVVVRLVNGQNDTNYTLVVRNNKKQIYTTRLNRANSSAIVNISGLTTNTQANLDFSITDSDGYSDYNRPSLTINYATISLRAFLYILNSPAQSHQIINAQSAMQRDVNSGYKVYFYFTPTADGFVRWKLDTNIKKSDKTDLSLSGRIDNVDAYTEYRIDNGNENGYIELKNIDTDDNFVIGRNFSASMTVELYDLGGVKLSSQTVSFSPCIIPQGDFFMVPANSYWNNSSENGYADTYFQNGNNITLEMIVGGDSEKYPSLYIIPKFYYGESDGETETWKLFETDALEYGAVTPDEDSENYFPNTDYDDSNRYQWLTRNSEQISKWKNYNKDRLVTDIVSTGTKVNIVIPYSVIENAMFCNTREGSTKSFADLKIAFYVVAIDESVKSNENIIVPLTSSGEYTLSNYAFKAQVEKSSFSVPSYVTGIEKKNGSKYISDKLLFFNLDTINQTSSVVSKTNSFNALVDASYNQSMTSDSGIKKIPFYVTGGNGMTSGLIQDSVGYTAFRASGSAFGYIKGSEFNKQFFGTSSRRFGSLVNGFTFEIAFRTDEHPTSDGTIFSFGDYTFDGNLSFGINVDLEEARFSVFNTTTSQTATTSLSLTQDEFYQLDFTLEFTNADGRNHVEKDTAIIKIYKNGIPTALASLPVSNVALTGTPTYNISLGATDSDMCFGCKAGVDESLRNYADVNFYGIRLYAEALTEQEIVKNWMISKSCINQNIVTDAAEHKSFELDWKNVINPMLRNNYYDSSWNSSLWDYAYNAAQNKFPGVADGDVLFDQMGPDGWKYDELEKEYYRPLPVVKLTVTQKGQKTADDFYKSYNETQADDNNKLISSGNWSSVFQGSFEFYDTNHQNAISNKNIITAWYMQGTSTQMYRSKNIEIAFVPNNTTTISGDLGKTYDDKPLFTPKPSKWLPENRFTLKSDVMDSAHANNAAIGRWINESGFMPLNAAQQDSKNKYRGLVKETLEGFPCAVFIDWGDAGTDSHSGTEFLGIYSFNLGRGSYFNLGFRQLKNYELTENSVLSDNATEADMREKEFADPIECDHASFVRRYIAVGESDTDYNPNIYSFECTTNEPDAAVGMSQPNTTLLEKVWDLKYTSNDDENGSIGRQRLNEIIRNISYINGDKLNFWDETMVPKYYYGVHSNGTFSTPLYVYRNPDHPNKYVLEMNIDTGSVNDDGTYNVLTGNTASAGGVSTHLVKDYMRWYEGLNEYHAADVELDENLNPIGEVPDKLSFDLGSIYAVNLGFTDKGDDTNFTPILTSAPKIDDSVAESTWMHYGSFSRYFVIANVFGMIDSLGKNLTLRTWNAKSKNVGTIVPAFYDMDTALGLDNGGGETVDPTVYLDYWINNNTAASDAIPLNVITEGSPYVDTEHTVMYDFYGDGTSVECYNWYDRTDAAAELAGTTKKLIGCYPKSGNTLPMPSTVRFNLNNSHLWHLVRFMPSIPSRQSPMTNSWAPLGQYAILRGNKDYKFNDIDTFYNDYYIKQNERVGEIVFALDYKEKYMQAYKQYGSDGKIGNLSYNDLTFCHGRRDDFVRTWLKKRLNFLDSVFNLSQKYKPEQSTGGNRMGIESGWASEADYFNTSLISATDLEKTPYLEGWSESSGVKINGNSGIIRGNVTANETTTLIVSVSNTQYKFFLREKVPTKIYFTEPSSKIQVGINNISILSAWENFKNLKLTIMNQGWKFLSLDLSNQASLEKNSDAAAFNLSNMTSMRDCNLYNFHTEQSTDQLDLNLTSLVKLETLNVSKSCFKTLALPNGGNLKTLVLRDSNLTGEIKLENLMSLQGTVDFSNTPGITKITISNCPKLKNIVLKNNSALEEIYIKNCNALTGLSYSGDVSTVDGVSTQYSKLAKISVLGSCDAFASFSVSNIPSEDLMINLSGAVGLQSISMSNIVSSNMPILPDYYENVSEKITKTDYPLFRADTRMSVTLNNVNFSGFLFGENNDRAIITYNVQFGEDSDYPKFEIHSASDEKTVENVVLNLAAFGKVSRISLSKCPNIKYVACPPTLGVDDVVLNSMTSLQRMFGMFPIFSGGSVFGYKTLGGFRICDWNNISKSSLAVKEMFEEVIDGEKTIDDFVALMHDSYEGVEDVQGAIPNTRLFVKSGTTKLLNAFNGTSISANDMYYIMLLVNLYNKEHKCIISLEKMFQNCGSISTYYSPSEDLSPSRYLFKWMNTVQNIDNMFIGSAGVQGVLYSPKPETTYSDSTAVLKGKNIGILTPLCLSVENFGSIGWNLNLCDNYAYWTPQTTSTYFGDGSVWKGVCDKITDVNGIFNNVTCITSACYDSIDTTVTYFNSSQILKPFKNATAISNSFNGINLNFTEGNKTVDYNGKYYTYSTVFEGLKKLTRIKNSFNAKLAKNTIVVDIFAGNPYSLANEADSYPNNINAIESSFSFTCVGQYAYFCLTDDMFQRIKNTLGVVSPVTDSYNLTINNKGMFAGTNVIKTYVKFNSSGTSSTALFPYGVFRGCTALTDAPSFFSDIDLKYYVDATNLSSLDITNFENPNNKRVEANQSEYLLDIPLPDFYASKPYTKVETLNGEVKHSPSIRMFADTVNLKNISAMFNRLKPQYMTFNAENGKKMYIPGAYVLSSKGLEGLQNLENVSYLFADNHYFRGNIPYGLLYTGMNSNATKVKVEGTDNLSAKFAGITSCSETSSDYNTLREKMFNNTIAKGSEGIYAMIDAMDDYLYIPDVNELFDPYVVDIRSGVVQTYSYRGKLYPKFRKATTSEMNSNKKYRRVYKNDIPWYQTYNSSSDGLGVSVETSNVEINMVSQNIKNMSYLFYKNDAAGYLQLRNSNDYDRYTNIYCNPLATDTDYLRRSGLYKWSGYISDDFIHTSDSSFNNSNLVSVNKSYNPYKFIANSSRDVNLNAEYEELYVGAEKVYFVNVDYDPRMYVINNNTNKLLINKFVFDGVQLSDADLNKIIQNTKNIIKNSDNTLGTFSDSFITSFVQSKIPEKWIDFRKNENGNQIYYASSEKNSEKTISDSSLNGIGDNELGKILEIKNVQNYFCPSDIFNYVESNTADIRYAFAETNNQKAKCSTSKYAKYIYGVSGIASDVADKKLSYYLEGNPYTGIPGRVSPMLFDDASLFSNIEGVFTGNPQFAPYFYPGEVKTSSGNNYEAMGELFDYRTFNSLKQLKSTYLLWANNIVPRKVRINPLTFQSNTNLQYLDYMFAGTLWFNTSSDDASGTQIPNGIFDNLSNIRSARATFTSPVNYLFNKDETPTISATSNITSGDPVNSGTFGECTTGEFGVGAYGVSWVPDDMFEDSSTTLEMVSNMFFFDQNLTNYPDIYRYEKLKDETNIDWEKKMYHTAYYLSSKLDSYDKSAFSSWWNLQTPTQTKDNGNKVYYQSSTFSSNLV